LQAAVDSRAGDEGKVFFHRDRPTGAQWGFPAAMRCATSRRMSGILKTLGLALAMVSGTTSAGAQAVV